MTKMNSHDKGELGSRMKRIGGQVAGIQRMLDEDRPLSEVLTQLSAVRAAAVIHIRRPGRFVLMVWSLLSRGASSSTR